MSSFNDRNKDYLELMKEYERYLIDHCDSQEFIEDFDEWLENEYGQSRSKLGKHKQNKKFNKNGN